jgi:hypothetical protein
LAGGALWQLAAASGAAVTSVVVALALPGLRWIALAGGSTAILGVLAHFMAERSRRRFQRRQFLARLQELDRQLGDEVTRQSAALEQAQPHAATLVVWAAQRDDRLWERRPPDPDFLALQVGVGQRRSLIEIEGRRPAERGPLADQLSAILARHDRIPRAPIALPGPGAPVVGIAGPSAIVEGLARSLLVQAAVLHAPRELRIALVAGSPEWSWARWLPHGASETGEALVSMDPAGADLLAAELSRRIGAASGPSPGPASNGHVPRQAGPGLLVLVDSKVGQRPAVTTLLDGAGTSGRGASQVIVLAEHRHRLPSGCSVVIEVDAPDSPGHPGSHSSVRNSGSPGRPEGTSAAPPACPATSAVMIGGELFGSALEGAGPVRFSVETLPAEAALDAARSLAPLTEVGAAIAGRERNAGLLEILGLKGPEAISVQELWHESR